MSIEDLIGFTPPAPPEPATDLADLPGAPARLAVSGKTRNLARLADWSDLEALWAFEANEAQLGEIAARCRPRYLNVWGFKSPDLSWLRPLAPHGRLAALELSRNTRLADLSALSGFPALRLLSIVSCPKVRDLAPVGELANLEILDLGGGMWNTFRVATLAPVARLEKLRFVALKAIRVEDESLAPLAGRGRLERLELSNQFPTEEFARLSVALPRAACTLFAPYTEVFTGRKAHTVRVTGKRKPILALPDDQAKLDRYVARFRALQDRFRQGG